MQNEYPEILTQFIVSIIIGILVIGFILVLFQLFQKRKLIQEKEKQQMKTDFEKELLQTQLEIQEEVLKNVSMEIHDNIGQILLSAKVNLSILQKMKLPPEAPTLIIESKQMLNKASEDISQLSHSLNSDRISELGVFECIFREVILFQQKGLFDVSINDRIENSGKTLAKETQLLIFRMFQEIISNIIKHAGATKIEISLEYKDKFIQLTITDNGEGFENTINRGGDSTYNGIGLRSLQSRTKLFGGELFIDSTLQKGTSISIFIPK